MFIWYVNICHVLYHACTTHTPHAITTTNTQATHRSNTHILSPLHMSLHHHEESSSDFLIEILSWSPDQRARILGSHLCSVPPAAGWSFYFFSLAKWVHITGKQMLQAYGSQLKEIPPKASSPSATVTDLGRTAPCQAPKDGDLTPKLLTLLSFKDGEI